MLDENDKIAIEKIIKISKLLADLRDQGEALTDTASQQAQETQPFFARRRPLDPAAQLQETADALTGLHIAVKGLQTHIRMRLLPNHVVKEFAGTNVNLRPHTYHACLVKTYTLLSTFLDDGHCKKLCNLGFDEYATKLAKQITRVMNEINSAFDLDMFRIDADKYLPPKPVKEERCLVM